MSTATTTPKAKPNLTKALAEVRKRHAKRQAAEVLTGVVVSTGGQTDAPTPSHAARAAAMVGRVCKGIATAPKALRAYRLATEYDAAIIGLADAGDHAKALAGTAAQHAEAEKRRKRVGLIAREVAIILPPLLAGGWFWATLALTLALAAELALLKVKAMHGKVVARTAQMLGISLLLEILLAVTVGAHPAPVDRHGFEAAWSPWNLLPAALVIVPAALALIGWAIAATKDDGSLADNIGAGDFAPEVPVVSDLPPVVNAIMEAGKLPKETRPMLVQPGVVYPRPGILWTASVDLGGHQGGPSAKRFLTGGPRHDLAAHLGLGDETMLVTVDRKRGSRLHVTGIVGDPWSDQAPNPLLRLDPIDTWRPVPLGVDIFGNPITYRIPGVHSLFGGGTGAGKSTAMANVWGAFALNPSAVIHVIDGGEDDTRVLQSTGLATSWTTDRAEGIDILRAVIAEINQRQHLLAIADEDKEDFGATPEWMTQNDLGHVLLIIDELPTYLQDNSDEAKEFGTLLTEGLQRARKTGVHIMLGIQSPSVKIFDSDARSIIAHRWAGRARDLELAAKILGSGTVGRGVDPRSLPQDVEGLGWWSTLTGDVVMRPYYLSRRDRRLLCDRGVELRKGTRQVTAADEDRDLIARVVALIREHGVDVAGRRVMRLRDVATHLDADQMQLRAVLSGLGIGTQIVRRTDSPADDNRAHYVLSDFPATRAM